MGRGINKHRRITRLMYAEGIGLKTPAPVEVQLSDGILCLLAEKARMIVREKQVYRNPNSNWRKAKVAEGVIPGGGGLLSSDEMAFMIGLTGEAAFKTYCGSRVTEIDLSLRRYGDNGYDFMCSCCGGWKIQVKSAQQPSQSLYFKATDDGGVIITPKWNIIVFAAYNRTIHPHLLGWQKLRFFDDKPLRRALVANGEWKNKYVDLDELRTMPALIDELIFMRERLN